MSDNTTPDGNWDQQSDRLSPTVDDCVIEGRPFREEVVDWRDKWFDVNPTVFDGYTFWEKGVGRIWAPHGEVVDPVEIEGPGVRTLWTRQRHWESSTNAVQRFYGDTTKNVIELSPNEVQTFVDDYDQRLNWWEDDWGYLTAAHEIAGELEPLGVGLYLHEELCSAIPKGR